MWVNYGRNFGKRLLNLFEESKKTFKRFALYEIEKKNKKKMNKVKRKTTWSLLDKSRPTCEKGGATIARLSFSRSC